MNATTDSLLEIQGATDPSINEEFKLYPWIKVIIASAVLVTTVSFVGNLLVITAFIKYKNLQDATNCLICNQSLADILACIMTILNLVFSFTPSGRNYVSSYKTACLCYLCLTCVAFVGSFFNILSISTERLVAITKPLFSLNPRKKTFIKIWIAGAWLGIFLYACIPSMELHKWEPGVRCLVYWVYNKVYGMYTAVIPMYVILTITAFLNLVIGFLALKIRRSKVGSVAIKGSTTSYAKSQQPAVETPSNNGAKHSRKVTLMLLAVVGVFYVAWLPYLGLTLMSLIYPLQYASNKYLLIAHEFAKILMMTNGAFNPFIYANRNPPFNKAFRRILGIAQSR